MRCHRTIRLVSALLVALWCSHAVAQDIYGTAGSWLDDRSQVFRLDGLRGMPAVVTMAYGACRRVCSTSLRMLEQLQARADAQHTAVNFVVIGLDPQEDRPKDWADYRVDHRLARSNWVFLSGDEASTRSLANRLGVRYWRYGEHLVHDFKIVLLSPQGRPIRSIDAFDQDLSNFLP